MTVKKGIANEVIVRRKILGITQMQLSALSDVGMKTIYKIEQGLGNPSIDTLEKVLDVLGLEFTFKLKK